MFALNELEAEYNKAKNDPEFIKELEFYFREYANRPSGLYYAERMTKDLGGAKVYLKREDLNHTGAHKINNVLGQTLLAKRMGKKKIIAETGAGQHGVAAATAAALFGMECTVYMGEEDMKRQELNVFRMRFCGRTSSVSYDSQRFSERYRQRDKRADFGKRRPASQCGSGMCRRRKQRNRNIF